MMNILLEKSEEMDVLEWLPIQVASSQSDQRFKWLRSSLDRVKNFYN